MNTKEILKKLNIEDKGKQDGDYYVITLLDYKDFNSTYNKLEKSLDLTKNSDASFLSEEEAHIQYETDHLLLELIAIFDEDNYTLNIAEG